MKLRKVLLKLASIVADEAEKNPLFHQQIVDALISLDDRSRGATQAPSGKENSVDGGDAKVTGETNKRPSNRRAPAVLDPVLLAREGEQQLKDALLLLNLDQLRDIVAEYGMDHGGLVMKWKTPDRVTERIVEVALQRARKGDAFRDQGDNIALAPIERSLGVDS
ncbi:hypothetical protein [Pseudoduganella rhizocola]|uniref:hypothetical protein n=1 Tax=Pseudoduganella rhizocola TaxID=3382643 RepID=UPI0038B53FCD